MNKKILIIAMLIMVVFLSASVLPQDCKWPQTWPFNCHAYPVTTPAPYVPLWQPEPSDHQFHPACYYNMDCSNPHGWTNKH